MEEKKGCEAQSFRIDDQVIHKQSFKHRLVRKKSFCNENIPNEPDQIAETKEYYNNCQSALLVSEDIRSSTCKCLVHSSDLEHECDVCSYHQNEQGEDDICYGVIYNPDIFVEWMTFIPW